MNKTYTYFNFKDLEGENISVACWTNYHRNGFTHNIDAMGVKARVCWCNRTWECFTYEPVLKKWAERIGGDLGEYIKIQIKGIEEHNREEAEKWFNSFKARYDALSDKTKEHLAKSDVHLTSVEQAESVMATSQLFDIMTSK